MGAVSNALGMSGQQGAYAGARNIPELQRNALSAMQRETEATQTPTTLQQAITGGQPVDYNTLSMLGAEDQRALAESPIAGQRLAASEVMNSPLSGGVYGDKGLQGSLANEYAKYEGSGLTPETQTELDQAMANTARQYGGAENSLAQSLASRGLASGPSGAAATQYTGLQGNFQEQLAQNQLKAAMDKIAMKRDLATQRMQLANQAGQAQNRQYQGQLAGVKSARDQMGQLGQQETANNNSMLAREHEIYNQQHQAADQQHQYQGPTLGEAFGAGIMGGIGGGASATMGSQLGMIAGGKGNAGGISPATPTPAQKQPYSEQVV